MYRGIVGVVAGSTSASFSYLKDGPKKPEWTFAYHLAVCTFRGFLNGFGNTIPKLITPPSNPKEMLVTLDNYSRNSNVIEFFRQNCKGEWCADAVDTGEVVGKWFIPNCAETEKVILYLHGGAYIMGHVDEYLSIIEPLAKTTKIPVFAINYRLAPQYVFPCGLIDAISGYLYILNEKKFKAKNIIVIGDSAGGGLALATAFALQDMNLSAPGGICCLSPWVDLTDDTESYHANGKFDYLTAKFLNPEFVGRRNRYTADEYLKNPFVSPIFRNDLKNLPPIFIQAGTAERFHGQISRFFDKLTVAGANAILELYQSHVHVFQILGLNATQVSYERIADWITGLREEDLQYLPIRKYLDFHGNYIF